MSSRYQRVLPRDAFNEADLLKCLGRLCLLIVDYQAPGWKFEHDNEAFEIDQDESDGSISVLNVSFTLNGVPVPRLFRPLNSRDKWPLFAQLPGDDCLAVRVFDDEGGLSL